MKLTLSLLLLLSSLTFAEKITIREKMRVDLTSTCDSFTGLVRDTEVVDGVERNKSIFNNKMGKSYYSFTAKVEKKQDFRSIIRPDGSTELMAIPCGYVHRSIDKVLKIVVNRHSDNTTGYYINGSFRYVNLEGLAEAGEDDLEKLNAPREKKNFIKRIFKRN